MQFVNNSLVSRYKRYNSGTLSSKVKVMIFPTIKELSQLLVSLKSGILDDADFVKEGDDLPSLDITVSSGQNGWNFQTGDNSYSGSCYGDPYWATASLYRRSNCREMAKDLIEQLRELSFD